MEDLIMSAISGNLGAGVILVVLWRMGFFKKNGNSEVERKLDTITDNHLHEVVEILRDIRENQREHGGKLDKIVEHAVHIKARINGKL